MDQLISRIVQQQNQALIQAICQKYTLDEDEMLKKYNIPQYYVIGGDGRSYQIEWKETGLKKLNQGSTH